MAGGCQRVWKPGRLGCCATYATLPISCSCDVLLMWVQAQCRRAAEDAGDLAAAAAACCYLVGTCMPHAKTSPSRCVCGTSREVCRWCAARRPPGHRPICTASCSGCSSASCVPVNAAHVGSLNVAHSETRLPNSRKAVAAQSANKLRGRSGGRQRGREGREGRGTQGGGGGLVVVAVGRWL